MNLFDLNLIKISEHVTMPLGNTIEIVIGKHVLRYEKLIDGFDVVFDVQFDGAYMDRDVPVSDTVKTFWNAALHDAFWEKPGVELVSHQAGMEFFASDTKYA